MPTSIFDLTAPAKPRDLNEVVAESTRNNEGGHVARVMRRKEAQAADQKRKDETPFGELVGASQVQGGIGMIHRAYQEDSVLSHADPEWKLPEKFQAEMDQFGIGTDQWELFSRATSQEHYELLREFALQNEMAKETRASFGMLSNFASDMTDPVFFAADAATGGLARGARAGRLANSVRAGLAAGTTNAAMTLGSSRFNSEIGSADIAISAAAGFALGSAFGAHRGEHFAESAKVEELARRDITGSPQSLGAARLNGLPDNPTPGISERTLSDAMQAQVDRGVDEVSIQPAFANIRLALSAQMGKLKDPTARGVGRWLFRDGVGYTDRNLAVKQSAGEYASVNRATLETQLHRGFNAAWTAARAKHGLSRWDRGGELAWSRKVADVLRGVRAEDETANQAAAAVRPVLDATYELGVRSGVLEPGSKNLDYFPQIQSKQAYQRIFGEMGLSEDQGVELYKQAIIADMRKNGDASKMEKFDEIAGDYAGTSDRTLRAREKADDLGALTADKQAAVRSAEEALKELADMPGKVGDRRRTAAQRRLEDTRRKLQRHGERLDKAKAGLKDALEHEQKTLHAKKEAKQLADDGGVDEELAELYARALIKRGSGLVTGDTGAPMRPLNTESVQELTDALRDAGASDAKIASVLGRYTAQMQEGAKVGAAKKRIRFDPNTEMTFTNRFGDDVTLKVTDFLDSDTTRVVSSHIREVVGWSSLAQKGNIRNKAELDALQQLLREQAIKAGDDPEKTLRMLDVGVKSIMGRSTEVNPNSTASRWSRALRDTQFLRVMNQVGFTLFTELGPTVAHAGLINTARSIAFIGDFLRRGADGTLKSGEARYIEDLVATGTEHLRSPAFMRIEDDAFMPSVYGDSKFGRTMENATMLGQRFTSIASGMAPMNTALQRIAGRATLMKLLQLANDKRALSEGMTRRMRSYGLDEEAQNALFASLRGIKKVEDITEAGLNLADRERVAAFMFRVTRQQVIEGDASDSIMLMHSAGGKLVTQFRSFMAYSYERHLLNSAYHWKDWNTYMMVMLSSSIAALQWAARTSLNTADDPEKRAKQLTIGNFVAAGVSQSSWGGVIQPIVDTALPLMGQDPVFANARSTGMSTNIVGGIPVVDFANRVMEASSLPAQAIRDDREVTRKELENAAKLFWFQNLTGWQNIQRMALKEAESRGLLSDGSGEAAARREDRDDKEDSWTAKSLFGLDTE
ncbi:hypothetical protein Xmar_16355 [Xanthomonas axonopodis pv. martyniicola]|uniref:hypothetical protein n=1 Tax=Xanthomonas axonopodis TaxID=53413 RepID=UPI000997EEB8|nr:hypothetical protein [Xanthomonas axonopodis]OOW71895.1 hypothetical protein Xmar_16355 [Xanthomonas axonopodis pv. martyniicola]OOW93484.1 hypothetical protein Xvtr_13405 [Xanthomonas campestris pv. vitiscarnosae]